MFSVDLEKVSMVHWFPDLERHTCGYCKTENGAVSYGMWAEQLTVDDYQNLIDRGWRRSGKYCYKPIMDLTCCPQYTIRCNTLDFKLTKSQKKIIKRFNKFIGDGIGCKEVQENDETMDVVPHEYAIVKQKPNISIDRTKKINICNPVTTIEASDAPTTSYATTEKTDKPSIADEKISHPKLDKPQCKKAKFLRLERKKQKLLSKGIVFEKTVKCNAAKSVEQFLNEIPANGKHKFKTKLISSEDINHKLENDKLVEYEVYKKYQMVIHNDPPSKCTLTGFIRFLVASPLMMVPANDSTAVTYGTFHQQYWLDDKLIAVAVLDVLPRCVSSVYFFYDPDYRFLTLGTYGSLREVQFVKSLYSKQSSLQFYYMGFYIHSCPKMRYKGNIDQSFLLCPETYYWFRIEQCLSKLNKNKYSRLNDDLDAIDENFCTKSDIDAIKVHISYCVTYFGTYKRMYGEQHVFDNIGRLIGKKNAANLLFISCKS
ncbi:hypothetical protein FQA39_LY10210 [Lamprigera yunnana]|nr:hypothetical protein FQA39_LY10210 [Lamprigera yunnana]